MPAIRRKGFKWAFLYVTNLVLYFGFENLNLSCFEFLRSLSHLIRMRVFFLSACKLAHFPSWTTRMQWFSIFWSKCSLKCESKLTWTGTVWIQNVHLSSVRLVRDVRYFFFLFHLTRIYFGSLSRWSLIRARISVNIQHTMWCMAQMNSYPNYMCRFHNIECNKQFKGC